VRGRGANGRPRALAIDPLRPEPAQDASDEEKSQYNTLIAHENAHARLCQDVFDLVSDKLIKEVFGKFLSPFAFDLPDEKCTREEIEKAIDEQLKAKCAALGEEAKNKINEQMHSASSKLDEGTTAKANKSSSGDVWVDPHTEARIIVPK
jgi:hypothetical protein